MLATAARAAFAAAFEHVVEGGLAGGGRLLDGFGREPHDGEDGALDRAEHRFVGRVGGAAQAGDHVGRGDRLEGRERVGEAPEDLRQDHARVAAGAHERPVPDRLAHLRPCSSRRPAARPPPIRG